jgi:hypothetical protein
LKPAKSLTAVAPFGSSKGYQATIFVGGGTQRFVQQVTVTVWLRFVLFPHPSLAVHVRVMILVQPSVFVTVTTLGVITPAHRSVNTGAENTGAVGHSIVAFAPCAVVTAGRVVSTTVIA